MSKVVEEFVRRIKCIDNIREFDKILVELNQRLAEGEYPEEFCQEIRQKQKYMKNRFSDEANKEKMLAAKENILESLCDFLNRENKSSDNKYLMRYLHDFYMFMEALHERELDRRATMIKDNLQQIKIENEYDLQHLLYAVLKPLYPDIRKEVAEDSGVGMIRSDLKIPCLNSVVEAKCTREKMSLKKLTEEIEADMVHYSEEHIVFFVYDKAKIIKDKQSYENYFNRIFDGKDIKIVIQQPIKL